MGFSAYSKASYSNCGYASTIIAPPPFTSVTPPGRTFSIDDCCDKDAIAYITPIEIVDYAIDWLGDNQLALSDGETILTSAWTSDRISVNAASPYIQENGTSVTVWLAIGNGLPGNSYLVNNIITTSGGRTLTASFVVNINGINIL